MSNLITLEEYAYPEKKAAIFGTVTVQLPLVYASDILQAKKDYPANEWARHVLIDKDFSTAGVDDFLTVKVPLSSRHYRKFIVQEFIEQYIVACSRVVKLFAEKYFDFDARWETLEDHRVTRDKLDNTWEFGDMFFSQEDILVALQDDIDFDILEEWYWNKLDCLESGSEGFPNLHNYAAYPKIRELGQEKAAVARNTKPSSSKNNK